MTAWLVCRECGVKEWVQDHTNFVHCPTCKKPRFAEDDDGQPLVVWSGQPQDPDDWGTGNGPNDDRTAG